LFFFSVNNQNNSSYYVEWSRSDLKILPSKIIIKGNVLTIKHFNSKDNGVYVCKLFSSNGKLLAQTELDLRLENQKSLQKPKASLYVINDQNLSFDNRVKVDCEIIGNDSFAYSEWTRTDSDMPLESSVIENSLIIDNFSFDDLGEYKCVVSNRAGQITEKILFYELKGQLKYLINSNETQRENIFTELTTTKSLTTEKNDQRFKFLFDVAELKIGDPLAIECFDLCKLNSIVRIIIYFELFGK
jgi:hypothetical protein